MLFSKVRSKNIIFMITSYEYYLRGISKFEPTEGIDNLYSIDASIYVVS